MTMTRQTHRLSAAMTTSLAPSSPGHLPPSLIELDFTPKLLGHSRAPILPQQVGRWWLEPVTLDTPLPSRARHRLEVVRASGLPIKAVVLFHEIPTEPAVQPSQAAGLVVRSGQLIRWAEQELPIFTDNAVNQARRAAPMLGSAARMALSLTAAGLGLGAVALATVTLATLNAVLIDPCLVIVTDGGDWIEIDRWDD